MSKAKPTQDELLEKAAEAERQAEQLRAAGDHHGARGMSQMAYGYFEDALAAA